MALIADQTCGNFTEALASNAPVPGGGGAAALAGAIGAALGNMVGSLTAGKKKYAVVESRIQEMNQQAMALQLRLLELADEDARVFEPLSKAYGMPRSTPEEQAWRDEVMAVCLEECCAVPLQIMQACCEAIDLCAEYAEIGSRLAVSDAGCGALLCKAALQAASLNVFINTKAMLDAQRAVELNAQADELLCVYCGKADAVHEAVLNQVRKG